MRPSVQGHEGAIRIGQDLDATCLTDGGSTTVDPDHPQVIYGQSPTVKAQASYDSRIQRQRLESECFECTSSTGARLFEVQTIREKPSLRIICPLISGVLRKASVNSPGNLQGDELFSATPTIFEPYELLFHHIKRISKAANEDTTGQTIGHVRLLLEFIKKERPSTWEKLNELENGNCRKISFEDVWLLYPPGTTVFAKDHGAWRAYKVERLEPGCSSSLDKMPIHCLYLDLDATGKWLTPKREILSIRHYSSDMPIEDLEVVPEWYFKGVAGFHAVLTERGERFWEYSRKVNYKEYYGPAWPQSSRQYPAGIIIDYLTSSKHSQGADNMPAHIRGSPRCLTCLGDVLGLPSHPTDSPHISDVCTRTSYAETGKGGCSPFLFCPPAMWAFSLKHKSWGLVSPDDIGEVKRQGSALNQLEMEEDNKEYLESAVLTHLVGETSRNSDDILRERGGGSFILLHGSPGTGKTFTAECLAAKHAIPLYKATYADLGTDPEVLEKRLKDIFLRAANWKALLLLDQTDIFIQAREVQDWRRSALVSTFLHHLDTSEALLFMTTNRIDNLDRSIEPRVTMPIRLPDINFKGQKNIWKSWISRLGNLTKKQKAELERFIDYDLKEIEEGAYTNMNGSQIQSCVTAASMLAGKNNESLNIAHIRKMLKLGREFRESIEEDSDSPRDRFAYLERHMKKRLDS
ncbi:P-loop containing nucleoside triphosphate hydrolase protein [Nemania sp. FL0031]|nr:P-loop containing nucleoside triphosphate hydrolase protein [Nemania sp. FL0031]